MLKPVRHRGASISARVATATLTSDAGYVQHTASGNEAAALDWSSYFPRKPKRPLDDVPSEYSVDSDDETLIVITPTPDDSVRIDICESPKRS